MEENNGASQSRHRSPAYPAVSLRIAVDKVRVLYPAMKRNAVPVETALEALGLKSSTGTRLIAALIMYGFLSDEGGGVSRKVRLSPTGYRFTQLEEDDPEIKGVIRAAARSPKIYREMIEEWPDSLPPDSTIKKFLTLEKRFNPEVIAGLIKDFRDTYEFAELNKDDTLTDEEVDTDDADSPGVTSPKVGTASLYNDLLKTFQEMKAGQVAPLRSDSTLGTEHSSVPLPREGMKTLNIELPEFREAVLSLPRDYTLDDLDTIKEQIELWGRLLKRPMKSGTLPHIRFGVALWQSKDGDYPVTVTGYIGERGGRQYVKTMGSDTGVPLDELIYNDQKELEM